MGTSESPVPGGLELNDSGCVQDDKNDESLTEGKEEKGKEEKGKEEKGKEETSMENGCSRKPELLDLSDDVLLCIFKYCSAHDLKALGFSCARLGCLIEDRSLWTRVRCSVACDRPRLRWLLGRLHPATRELSLTPPPPTRADNGSQKEVEKEKKKKQRTSETITGEPTVDDNHIGDQGDNNQQNGGIEGPFPLLRQRAHRHINTLPGLFLPRETGSSIWRQSRSEPSIKPIFPLWSGLMTSLRSVCPQLHTLRLHYCNINCKKTSLSQFPPSLVHLSLRGCKCYNLPLDKTFLFKINDYLPLLEYLDLSECGWLEPASLLPLSKAPVLETLLLRDCAGMTEFVAYMSLATRYGFRKLKVLDLRGCGVGDSEVSALGWLPELAELRLAAPACRRTQTTDNSEASEVRETLRDDWELAEPDYYKSSPEPDSPDPNFELDSEAHFNQLHDSYIRHTEQMRVHGSFIESLNNARRMREDLDANDNEPEDRENRKRRLDNDNAQQPGPKPGPSKVYKINSYNRNESDKKDDFKEDSNSSTDENPYFHNDNQILNVDVNVDIGNENQNSDIKTNADDASVENNPVDPLSNESDASSLRKETTESSACSCRKQNDTSNDDKPENDTLETYIDEIDTSSNDSQLSNVSGRPRLRRHLIRIPDFGISDDNKETSTNNSQDEHSNPMPSTSRDNHDENAANKNKSLKRKHSESDTDSDDDDKKPDKDANKRVAHRNRDDYRRMVNINTTALSGNDYIIKVSYERVPSKDINKKSNEQTESTDKNKDAEKEKTDETKQKKNTTEQSTNTSETDTREQSTNTEDWDLDQSTDTTEQSTLENTSEDYDADKENMETTEQSANTTEQSSNASDNWITIEFEASSGQKPIVTTSGVRTHIEPSTSTAERNIDTTEQGTSTSEQKITKTSKQNTTEQSVSTAEQNSDRTKQRMERKDQSTNTEQNIDENAAQEANEEPDPNRGEEEPQPRFVRFRRNQSPFVVCPALHRRIENQLAEVRARHHVLYVNFGQQFHLLPPYNGTSVDNSSLVSDSAIRRFGRADGEEVNIVNIGPNLVPGMEVIGGRPNRSNLRILQATGYRGITNRSLIHLATAAPHLQQIDFSNTGVTQEGVDNFRSLRPDCEVVFSEYTEDSSE